MTTPSIEALRKWRNTAKKNATAANEDYLKLNRVYIATNLKSAIDTMSRLRASLHQSQATDKEIQTALRYIKADANTFLTALKQLNILENFIVLSHTNAIPWRTLQKLTSRLDVLQNLDNLKSLLIKLKITQDKFLEDITKDFVALQNVFFKGERSILAEARERVAHYEHVSNSADVLLATVDTELTQAEMELTKLHNALQQIRLLDNSTDKAQALNCLQVELGKSATPTMLGEEIPALLFYEAGPPDKTPDWISKAFYPAEGKKQAIDPLDFTYLIDPIKLLLDQLFAHDEEAYSIDGKIAIIQKKIVQVKVSTSKTMQKFASCDINLTVDHSIFKAVSRQVLSLPLIDRLVYSGIQHNVHGMLHDVFSQIESNSTDTTTKCAKLRALMLAGEVAVNLLAQERQSPCTLSSDEINTQVRLMKTRNAIEHSITDNNQDYNIKTLLQENSTPETIALWRDIDTDITLLKRYFLGRLTNTANSNPPTLQGMDALIQHLKNTSHRTAVTTFIHKVDFLLSFCPTLAKPSETNAVQGLAQEMIMVWLGQSASDWNKDTPCFDQILMLPTYKNLSVILYETIQLRMQLAHWAPENYTGNAQFAYQGASHDLLVDIYTQKAQVHCLSEHIQLRTDCMIEADAFKGHAKAIETLKVNTDEQANTYRRGIENKVSKISGALFDATWKHMQEGLSYDNNTQRLTYDNTKMSCEIDEEAMGIFFACYRDVQNTLSGIAHTDEDLINEYKEKYDPVVNGDLISFSSEAIDKLFELLFTPDIMTYAQYDIQSKAITANISRQIEKIDRTIQHYNSYAHYQTEVNELLNLRDQLTTLHEESNPTRAFTASYQHAGDISPTLRKAAAIATTPDRMKNSSKKVTYNFHTPSFDRTAPAPTLRRAVSFLTTEQATHFYQTDNQVVLFSSSKKAPQADDFQTPPGSPRQTKGNL